MLTIAAIDGAIRVEIVPSEVALSPTTRMAVENVWSAERAKAPYLFDGPLFSIVAIEPGRILGRLTSYRYLVAQQRDPSLRPELDIRPLGVTGILTCRDGIVFGQRAFTVALDPGRWELAPSGSVDGAFRAEDGTVDVRAQLLCELAEEIGIEAGSVIEPPQPFALAADGENGVTDLGLLIRTGVGADAIERAFAVRPTREYRRQQVVARTALDRFAEEVDLAPLSRALLTQALFL
jgi:hypothetical protein